MSGALPGTRWAASAGELRQLVREGLRAFTPSTPEEMPAADAGVVVELDADELAEHLKRPEVARAFARLLLRAMRAHDSQSVSTQEQVHRNGCT